MSLVRDIHREPIKQKRVGSLVALCKDLGMRKGKMIAQGAHASMRVLLQAGTLSEDRTQFVHSHPHGSEGHTSGGPKVDFEATFAVPGTYKGWAQFNVGTAAKEQVITVPFTFSVAKGDGHGEAKPHEHGEGEKKKDGHDHK